MRILVTGAAGFIGSHAVDVLRAAGHEVQGLDSLTPAVHTGRPDYLPADFDLAVGDVRDPDAVRRAVAGADVVCHQAALVGLGVDLSRPARLLGRERHRHRGAAGGHGPGRGAPPGAGLVHGGLRGGRLRLRQRTAGCGPPRAATDDLRAGPVRAALPALRPVAADRGTISEDAPLDPRNAYAASKLAQEHLAATWARMTGGVRGRAPLPQRVRAADAAGHAVLRGGGHLPVRRWRRAARRRSTRTASSAATSCTCTTWPGPTWPRCAPGCQARCGRSTWRQRRAAHGRRDGGGAGRRVRRPGARR